MSTKVDDTLHLKNFIDVINRADNSKQREIKIDIEDYKGAIEDFNKAIEISPNFYGYYEYRGECKLNLKQYKGAIEDFNKAIEINSDNKKSIEFKKQCIQKLDNISDAFINSLSLKLMI